MIPTVFASAYTVFPRSDGPHRRPIIGLVATLAPTIGPTIGGYITDMMSWHWLFFINIVPGIGMTIGVSRWSISTSRTALLDISTGRASCSWRASSARSNMCWKRAAQRNGWKTRRPRLRGDLRGLGVRLLLARAHRAGADRRPQNLHRPQSRRRLPDLRSCSASGSTASPTCIRAISPQMRGYNALMIGETMFVSGLAMFLTALIVGRLMAKYDMRSPDRDRSSCCSPPAPIR